MRLMQSGGEPECRRSWGRTIIRSALRGIADALLQPVPSSLQVVRPQEPRSSSLSSVPLSARWGSSCLVASSRSLNGPWVLKVQRFLECSAGGWFFPLLFLSGVLLGRVISLCDGFSEGVELSLDGVAVV